jgi:hypothetical protein
MIAKEVHRHALLAWRCAHLTGQPVSIREYPDVGAREWACTLVAEERNRGNSVLVRQDANGAAGGHAQALLNAFTLKVIW